MQPLGPLIPNELIALYNKALSHLRDALNDSNMCSRVEILLAVMVLAVIQGRIEGPASSWVSAHGAGALQMMRLRKWPRGGTDLEIYLYHHIRYTLLNQSIFNPAVVLTYEEYRDIEQTSNALGQTTVRDAHSDACWVQLAEIITQARVSLSCGDCTGALKTRAQELHREVLQTRTLLHTRLREFECAKQPAKGFEARHALQQSLYSLTLTLQALVVCLRRALDASDPDIGEDAADLCQHALRLAGEARGYQPFGSLWVVPVLMVIWCATQEQSTRIEIQDAILDHRSAAVGPSGVVPLKEMEWMARRLTLCDGDHISEMLPC